MNVDDSRVSTWKMLAIRTTIASFINLFRRIFKIGKRMGPFTTFNLWEMSTGTILSADNASYVDCQIEFECAKEEGAFITGVDWYATDLEQDRIKLKIKGRDTIPHGVTMIDGDLTDGIRGDHWVWPEEEILYVPYRDKVDWNIENFDANATENVTAVFHILDWNLNQ